MEKALRYEFNQISDINNKIYPTNAPEGGNPPYLVYILSNYHQMKTLNGFTDSKESSYLLNILGNSYGQMKELTDEIKTIIYSFLKRQIGVNGIFIEDLTIENVSEQYEHELKLYRGIIDVTFYYKEE